MFSILNNKLLPAGLLITCLLMAGVASQAQLPRSVTDFEVINRQRLAVVQDSGNIDVWGGTDVSVKGENEAGALSYRVTGIGISALVPALTHIAVARSAQRIWVFGDTIYNHTAANGYVNVYGGTGQLIKSIGLVGRKPYAAAVAENGAMAFVGNVAKDGKPIGLLSLFDADGEQRWSAVLPPAVLSRVYVSDDNQQVAVSMYYPDEYTMKLLVFDRTGRLAYTHRGNVAGVGFLPSGKMVLCQGDTWSCYDMSAGFSKLCKGILPGTALGSRPVAVHPAKDIFFILSTEASQQQICLQAFDAGSGVLVAQQRFESSGERQRYRALETTKDGAIRFNTEYEYLSVRLK